MTTTRAVPLRPELARAVDDVLSRRHRSSARALDAIVKRCREGDVAAVGVAELASVADALRARTGGER